MTVTRTTIWTRTSNRAAREAPAVVRCGRVRPQLNPSLRRRYVPWHPVPSGRRDFAPNYYDWRSDYRYRRWQYRVWRPAKMEIPLGRDLVERSFVEASDRILNAPPPYSTSEKPYMKLALARMYHEILTKVGCIEADAPVPSVLE